MGPSEQLESYLQENDTPYLMRHHAPAMTARQLAETENIDAHEVAKVVVLRDHSAFFMMVLPADYQLDLKTTREMLDNQGLSMATEQDLKQLFPDCELGAMPPFGPLYDINVYVEQDLSDGNEIEFSAGSHSDAIRMRFDDWQNLVHPMMGHFSFRYH